jgi:hypothetical protein
MQRAREDIYIQAIRSVESILAKPPSEIELHLKYAAQGCSLLRPINYITAKPSYLSLRKALRIHQLHAVPTLQLINISTNGQLGDDQPYQNAKIKLKIQSPGSP